MNVAIAASSATWKEELEGLRAFVASEPCIGVSATSLSIPRELRDGFYERVARVQSALTREVLGRAEIERAAHLARVAGDMRDRLVAMSNLSQFRLPAALEAMIRDPAEALSKPVFGMVLDAVQNGWADEQLTECAQVELPAYRDTMERCAYEAWAYYGVVAALKPVRFYEVFSPDTVEVRAMPTGTVVVGEQITSPERRMPECSFECADGRVFAMKSEVARELDFYGAKIKRRRDMSLGGNSVNQMAHRVLLLYRIQDARNVPLIADRDHLKVLACDLMLEAVLPGDMDTSGLGSAMFVERLTTMHSKRPVQVLTPDARPYALLDRMQADPDVPAFERRVTGLDESVLDDVAALLKEPGEREGERS